MAIRKKTDTKIKEEGKTTPNSQRKEEKSPNITDTTMLKEISFSNSEEEEEDSQTTELSTSNTEKSMVSKEEEDGKKKRTRKASQTTEAKKKACETAEKEENEEYKKLKTKKNNNEYAILNFIRTLNEPVGFSEVCLKFQTGENKMTNVIAKHILTKLVSQNLIIEKKKKVGSIYLPFHTKEDNEQNTEELTVQIGQATDKNTRLKAEVEELRKEKAEIKKQPTDGELLLEIDDLERETRIKVGIVDEFKKKNTIIDPKKRDSMVEEIAEKIQLKRKIKSIFKRVMEDVCEGMNKKKEDFMEELGITLPKS